MLRILRVGDKVVVNKSWSSEQRTGTVSEISIQTLAEDLQVKLVDRLML